MFQKKSNVYISLFLVLGIFILNACSATKNLKSELAPQKVSKIVTEIIYLMIEDAEYRAYYKFIAPSFWKEIDLTEKDEPKVNNYMPIAFTMKEFEKETNIQKVEIWGEDKNWVHELFFEIVEEKGKLYIMPSGYNGSYIAPWHSVNDYINHK